jgi:hypothetical protein
VTMRESYQPRVHIGCIRLQAQMVSSRLARHTNCPYAAGLATGGDWPLLLRFSDKEEVPGSSPGSPTADLPVNRHFSCGQMAGHEFLEGRRGCILGAGATPSLRRVGCAALLGSPDRPQESISRTPRGGNELPAGVGRRPRGHHAAAERLLRAC